MSAFDPGATMVAVDKGADRLERAADAYHDAVERFEKAEEAFDLAMAKGRIQADMSAEKLPSQDRRQDLALTTLQREQPEVYTEFFAAKAHKEALAVRYRALSASVSARQSLLKAIGS